MSTCHQLNVPVVKQEFSTPTLRARSPLVCRKVHSARAAIGNSLQPPPFARYKSSPTSSPRNIQDRLIPCRSQTDMELAQHLLSPMSRDGKNQVTRILNFGTKRSSAGVAMQPLTSMATTARNRLRIPTKPDRVMAAPGTFLECGFQSAQWAPSANLVVALESGVYVCKINEDCNVAEIRNNSQDAENPFCHVIWNNDGNSVICGKMSGEVQICDLRHPGRRTEWYLMAKHSLRAIALEHDHLLTCGTAGNGVRIYDLRQNGGSAEPILSLKSRSGVNSLAWSPNGHLLAGGCESGLTYLWDVRHPSKEMALMRAQERSAVQVVNWCTWKPSLLLTGSSFPHPSLCIQNTATGILLTQVECGSEITGIQFNAQLKQVATSHHSSFEDSCENHAAHGTDSSVQLWQLTSNKLNPLLELGQHEEGIVSMSASVNSNQLLTMGGDELLCLWHWSESSSSSATNKAGQQTARSQLDPTNLIR